MDNEPVSDRLDGRVALVTGGGRGIGRAICLALAAKGAVVGVHYHSSAAAVDEVAAHITGRGGQAVTFQADLADGKAINALIDSAIAKLGKIDILVNNAGEMTDRAVIDMSDDEWERALTLNLTAAFRCSRACIPGMKARGWGRIINIGSQVAYTGSSNHAHYAAAKAGLLGLTFSLAKELGTTGITANLIAPGRIVTDLLTTRMAGREAEWLAQTPLNRLGQPEEIAGAVAFLASDAAAYITGANLNINGGLVMG